MILATANEMTKTEDDIAGLANASRARMVANKHDPLALVANTYATTNNHLCTSSDTRNQPIVQVDRVKIQSRDVWNSGSYVRRTADNQGDSAGNDEADILLTNEHNDFLLADASGVKEFKDLNATVCMIALIQQIGDDSDNEPIYHSRFISEEIIEDATNIQLKMKGKFHDPVPIKKKVKFVVINYNKMNDLYKTFVLQVELSLEQKYFSEASTSNVTPVTKNVSNSSSPPLEMLKPTFVDHEDSSLQIFCYNEVKSAIDYLHAIFKVLQKEFIEYVQEMMNAFELMESELYDTLKQNELLNDRLLEAILTHDVEKYVLLHSETMNDNLNVEIEKVKIEPNDV
nr:hypothetical protein [Tanacetum cinerariifolium]